MKKRFGYDELMACSYNAMIPYIERGLKPEECPFYNEMSEYEINLYKSVQKDLFDQREKHSEIPIHLDTMEKDWD